MMQHNYLAELLKMDFPPGAAYQVTVLHDDWCAFFTGRACNCSPEIVPLELTP